MSRSIKQKPVNQFNLKTNWLVFSTVDVDTALAILLFIQLQNDIHYSAKKNILILILFSLHNLHKSYLFTPVYLYIYLHLFIYLLFKLSAKFSNIHHFSTLWKKGLKCSRYNSLEADYYGDFQPGLKFQLGILSWYFISGKQ